MKETRINRVVLFFLFLLLHGDMGYAYKSITPPTLCKQGETILATCGNKTTKKIMSICALQKEINKDFDFIEYRFGTSKKIELTQRFDLDTQDVMPLYRGLGTSYNVYYGFLRDYYYYVISVPQELPDALISIWITNVKTKKQKTIECSKGVDYWDGEKRLTSTKLVKEAGGDEIFMSEDGVPK